MIPSTSLEEIMRISKHASTRMSQRGISQKTISLICQFGESLPNRGVVRKFIRKRDIDWILREIPEEKQSLEKAVRRTLVMNINESFIITAY